ncbi:MAG: VOC family protein [Planctomycetaceae bacterium]
MPGWRLVAMHHLGMTVSNFERSIAFYLLDPDGYVMELFEPRGRA